MFNPCGLQKIGLEPQVSSSRAPPLRSNSELSHRNVLRSDTKKRLLSYRTSDAVGHRT